MFSKIYKQRRVTNDDTDREHEQSPERAIGKVVFSRIVSRCARTHRVDAAHSLFCAHKIYFIRNFSFVRSESILTRRSGLLRFFSMDTDDDLPLAADAPLRSHAEFKQVLRFYDENECFGPDVFALYRAIALLISSNDPDSGRMLNYMFEAGVPRHLESVTDTPIPILAANAWKSPAYADILSTLIEFHFDFDDDATGVSARSIVEERAPGIFQLLALKAHLVSSGAWPDFASIAS